MDAVEFLKAKDRICGDSKCETCMLKAECFDYYHLSTHYWDEMVATVEHWVRDNPERTRQTELLKNVSDCKMDGGVPIICPKPWIAATGKIVILLEIAVVVRIAVILTGVREYKYVV